MTWSLKVEDGDLIKGRGRQLATVHGPEKVVQDLKHWIMTNIGSDPIHRSYGSTLGIDEEQFVFIGDEAIFVPENRVEHILDEIARVIDDLRKRQLARLEEEINRFSGRHTFTESEIIQDYEIEYEELTDSVYVDVTLSMLSGEQIQFELPVEREF